jgi:hypothetical protein
MACTLSISWSWVNITSFEGPIILTIFVHPSCCNPSVGLACPLLFSLGCRWYPAYLINFWSYGHYEWLLPIHDYPMLRGVIGNNLDDASDFVHPKSHTSNPWFRFLLMDLLREVTSISLMHI